MKGKCAKCGVEGEMQISDCGLHFCSYECRKQYRYRPNMTDETFEWDTTIDELELDDGKEHFYLKAVDQFYSMYSGYRVIITQERIFYHNQLGGFRTVKSARVVWEKLKKDRNLQSWGDLQNPNKEPTK